MFVSSNQFYFFIESLFMGVLLGVFYEIFHLLKVVLKNKIVGEIIDFSFFPVICISYLKAGEIFNFPNFRLYIFIGVLLGFVIYLLSFHEMLAKVFRLVYNKTVSFIRRKNRERKQKAKARVCSDGNVDNNSLFSHSSFGLSVRKYWCKNQGEKRPYCRKR